MKTAISIPDDLFDDAERLAQTLHKSRSRLYGDAMREYLARHSPDRVTDTLDRLCGEAPAADDFAARAAQRTFERAEW
jgi:predicted transcriptional regulator